MPGKEERGTLLKVIDGRTLILKSSIRVVAEEEGQRLDAYLSRKLTGCSRNQLKQWIEQGLVVVEVKPAKASYPVRAGDSILVSVCRPSGHEMLTPVPMKLDILYEDDEILVINKAPGLVVHPGAGHREGTLVHGLLAHCPRLALQGAPLRPGIVHRLDRDTSGVLAVAKTERAYLDLIRQFKEHCVEKVYLALVYGSFSALAGEVRTCIGRHPADRKKMAVLQKRGREAITYWEVRRGYGEVSLLRVAIETGRTHQIRVHMNHIGHPVVGDSTYGGGTRRAKGISSKPLKDVLAAVDRQMLHAWRLGMRHPGDGREISFEAPLPGDFSDLLSRLDQLQP